MISLAPKDTDGAKETQCSRAGCRATATSNIVWRNPKIHAADRRKIWLACNEHEQFLFEFLTSRSFPAAIEPLKVSS